MRLGSYGSFYESVNSRIQNEERSPDQEGAPMIDGTFVLDTVLHAYNFTPENIKNPEVMGQLSMMLYGLCASSAPRNQPEYTLDFERFMSAPDPDLLAHAVFAE